MYILSHGDRVRGHLTQEHPEPWRNQPWGENLILFLFLRHRKRVQLRWAAPNLADYKAPVPFAQLDLVDVDYEDSLQAIEDWAYWVEMGYEF